ncbi:MAG: type II secretion system protein [Verrucomicrobiota bacterium JB024]|nr:type II secretion system protein [Verrucomicrobiota bacterium JB024]
MAQPRPVRRAFSLIELLVVIAVIGALAGILIPTIGKVRESANHSTNVSNLRSLGNAFAMYASEHGGRLPPVFHVNSSPAAYWRRATLEYAELDPNYKPVGDALFDSPYLSPVIVEMVRDNGGRPYITSYAMNERLQQKNRDAAGNEYETGYPVASITNPADTILATEGLMGSTGKNTVPGYSVYEPTYLSNKPLSTYNGGRDALMVDGSVRFFEDAEAIAKHPYNRGGPQDLWSPVKGE